MTLAVLGAKFLISKLCPELANISADDKLFEEITARVFPEYLDC